MKKGFRYWWEDHKRPALLALLLGFLFCVANLDMVGMFYARTLDSVGSWLVLFAVFVGVGVVGLILTALTTWALTFVLLASRLIASVGLAILGKNSKDENASIESNGISLAAAGLAVAYWIGYRFYFTWIK